MVRKNIKIAVAFFLLCAPASFFAFTLEESLMEVIRTNPDVKDRIVNYEITQQEKEGAFARFYPTLDLVVGATNDTETGKDVKLQKTYPHDKTGAATIELNYNLFNGFMDKYHLKVQDARVKSAYYSVVEKEGQIGLSYIEAYLGVLKQKELLELSEKSFDSHQEIFEKIKLRFDGGIGRKSEYVKSKSLYDLSQVNIISQKALLQEAEVSFKKFYMKSFDSSEFVKPFFNFPLPASLEDAEAYATKNNPSVFVSQENIAVVKNEYLRDNNELFPKLNLKSSYARKNEFYSFHEPSQEYMVSLQANYSLYDGGRFESTRVANRKKVEQREIDLQNVRLQVLSRLRLAWNAYAVTASRINYLKEYVESRRQSLEAFNDEFSIGRADLFYFIEAESDYTSSMKTLIEAEYELLFAKYRISEAMGLLVPMISGDKIDTTKINTNNILEKNLQKNRESAQRKKPKDLFKPQIEVIPPLEIVPTQKYKTPKGDRGAKEKNDVKPCAPEEQKSQMRPLRLPADLVNAPEKKGRKIEDALSEAESNTAPKESSSSKKGIKEIINSAKKARAEKEQVLLKEPISIKKAVGEQTLQKEKSINDVVKDGKDSSKKSKKSISSLIKEKPASSISDVLSKEPAK